MPPPASNAFTPLSLDGEQAIASLKEAGCDEVYLRVLLSFPSFTNMPRKRVEALRKRIRRIPATLTSLSQSAAGWFLYPPVDGPSWLISLGRALTRLDGDLQFWLRRSRRRAPLTDLALAFVCSHVLEVTGKPHDDDVAALWGDMRSARPLKAGEVRTAEAVRQFRVRHKSLLAECLKWTRQRTSQAHPPPQLDQTVREPT